MTDCNCAPASASMIEILSAFLNASETLIGEPLDRLSAMVEQVIDKMAIIQPKLHQIELDKALRIGKSIEALRAMNVPDEMIDAIIFGRDSDNAAEKTAMAEMVKFLVQYLSSLSRPQQQEPATDSSRILSISFVNMNLNLKMTQYITVEMSDLVDDLKEQCYGILSDEYPDKRISPSLKLLDQNGNEVVDTSKVGIEINSLMLDGVVPAMVEWQFTE